MATIHISEEEAVRDMARLLDQLSEDTSFVIERASRPAARLCAADTAPMSIDECIALLESRPQATQDDTFADDIDAVVAMHREPLDSSIWD